MEIVFTVGTYVPSPSAVGNCVKNVACCLEESDNVTVIALDNGPKSEPNAAYRRQEVLRISTCRLSLRRRATALLRSDKWYRRLGAPGLALARTADLAALLLPGASLDRTLVRAYLRELERLPVVPDLVVPAAVPFEGVVAANLFKRTQPKTVVIPVFLDQFSESGSLNRWEIIRKIRMRANLRAERAMLECSDAMLHVSWGPHLDEFHPDLANKALRVEHPMLARPEVSAPREGNGQIVYAGSLSKKLRNPDYAFELISRLPAEACVRRADFFVPNPERFAYGETKGGLGSTPISLRPAVPAAEIHTVLADASWLLSIGNSVSNQHPSKVYEYMALGKPLVHIASQADDPVADVLARYPLALCLFEDAPFEESLHALCSFLMKTRSCHLDFDAVAALFPEETPEFFARTLIETSARVRQSSVVLSP